MADQPKPRNRVRCKSCDDVIESQHRHDFVRCKCGKVFVDGGSDYMRRGFPVAPPEDHYEEKPGPPDEPKPTQQAADRLPLKERVNLFRRRMVGQSEEPELYALLVEIEAALEEMP